MKTLKLNLLWKMFFRLERFLNNCIWFQVPGSKFQVFSDPGTGGNLIGTHLEPETWNLKLNYKD